MTSSNTTAGSNPLAYDVAGHGDPVVFVHAGIADRRMWKPQVTHFARYFTAVTFDMRGFGESPLPETPFSPRADIAGLLDHLSLERAHLVGCSMGATTALELAIEYPDRVGALVLVNSGAPGFTPEGGYYEPPGWDDVEAAFVAGDHDAVADFDLRLWVDGIYRSRDDVAPWIRAAIREMDLIALRNEARRDELIRRTDPPAGTRLDEVHAPTLVIVSELDVPDMMPLGKHLAAGITHARLEEFPATAHLPNMEAPDAFNELVAAFLMEVTT